MIGGYPTIITFGDKPPGAHDAADPQPRGEFDGAFKYNLSEQNKIEKQREKENEKEKEKGE